MPKGQKAGPKGRKLEVGAQRAPRLLVYNNGQIDTTAGRFLSLYASRTECKLERRRAAGGIFFQGLIVTLCVLDQTADDPLLSP